MKSINLTVYTGKEIQNFLSILGQFQNIKKSTKIEEVISILDSYVQSLSKENQGNRKQKQIKGTDKVVKAICPSCEKGYLWPTPNYEDLNILSCKKCRYSTILEEEIENG